MPFDGSKLDPVTALLVEARERIETQGWCKRTFTDGEGRVCMEGALGFSRQSCFSPVSIAALRRLEAVVLRGQDYYAVHEWNDSASRTKEDVLAAFDAAIAEAVGD